MKITVLAIILAYAAAVYVSPVLSMFIVLGWLGWWFQEIDR